MVGWAGEGVGLAGEGGSVEVAAGTAGWVEGADLEEGGYERRHHMQKLNNG